MSPNIDRLITNQSTFNNTIVFFDKFSFINDNEIIKAINALKDDSSPGLDGITVKMLKSNINILIRPLSHIFNLAISNSTIPDSSAQTLKYQILINPLKNN